SNSSLTNLEPLSGLYSLESLDLSDNSSLTNLEPLLKLDKLKSLDIRFISQNIDTPILEKLEDRGVTVIK
ncbi:MAG: hypothetical protein AAFP92_09285, partial [Bacteroidota bacterium]